MMDYQLYRDQLLQRFYFYNFCRQQICHLIAFYQNYPLYGMKLLYCRDQKLEKRLSLHEDIKMIGTLQF